MNQIFRNLFLALLCLTVCSCSEDDTNDLDDSLISQQDFLGLWDVGELCGGDPVTVNITSINDTTLSIDPFGIFDRVDESRYFLESNVDMEMWIQGGLAQDSSRNYAQLQQSAFSKTCMI